MNHDDWVVGSIETHEQSVGGARCLDFTNTVSARGFATATDRLATYADLVAWGVENHALDPATAAALLAQAEARPAEAAHVLEEARALREAIYRLVFAQSQGLPPDAADLDLLNRALGPALNHLRLMPGTTHCVWGWDAAVQPLDRMLWPVVRSAAELLTSDELRRVHRCAGDTCGWLFIDRSKNHSRRWCDMKECGNVAKVRRHRRRKAGQE